jgi:predicted esterase
VHALLLAGLLAAGGAAADDGPPFPPGTSSQRLEGLRCSIVMPEAFDAAKERSLLVVLHGAGGTETGMAGSLQSLAADDFVVVAPKSAGQTWSKSDLDAVKKIVADLKKRLHVGETRLHAAGFSNGGWNLAPVAFDEDLRFTSACWIAAGYNGGSVPKHAKKGMGALALAGANDPNRGAAEKTPDLLQDKVRSAMCRIQPGKAHEWPDGLVPFYRWWLLVQEGRFVPGECLPFDWVDDEAKAREGMAASKTGGLLYLFSKDQAGDAAAKAFQNETLLDPAVQHFGRQLVAWRQEKAEAGAVVQAEKIQSTPAVVVCGPDGKTTKVLQGKISAQALAAALRAVAPDKAMPKK